jgi:hypothetical protein
MAGAANSIAPEVVQGKVNSPSAAAVQAVPASSETSPEPKLEDKELAASATASSASVVDRAAIARVVEKVLAAQGIARGSGVPNFTPLPAAPPAAKQAASPASIAAEIADRFFGATANAQRADTDRSPDASVPAKKNVEAPVPPSSAGVPNIAKKSEAAAKATIEVQVFVSENDVRRAMTRSEKIFISRKTILTPSARDLGLEHEVFVETETGSIR